MPKVDMTGITLPSRAMSDTPDSRMATSNDQGGTRKWRRERGKEEGREEGGREGGRERWRKWVRGDARELDRSH